MRATPARAHGSLHSGSMRARTVLPCLTLKSYRRLGSNVFSSCRYWMPSPTNAVAEAAIAGMVVEICRLPKTLGSRRPMVLSMPYARRQRISARALDRGRRLLSLLAVDAPRLQQWHKERPCPRTARDERPDGKSAVHKGEKRGNGVAFHIAF